MLEWRFCEADEAGRVPALMIRSFVIVALCSALACSLSGCVKTYGVYDGVCRNSKIALPILLDSTNLKALFEDMAAELCIDTCSDCALRAADRSAGSNVCASSESNKRQTVLVTDFADIQTLIPNQSGILMGELMRSALNKVCCYKIAQAEFGRYFKLSENGLVVLTRKSSEVKKDEYLQPEVVIGTYSYLNSNKVMVFVRKINTETGQITKMVTREVDYSCLGGILSSTVK